MPLNNVPVRANVYTGSYAGNNSGASRQITVGGIVKYVLIKNLGSQEWDICNSVNGGLYHSAVANYHATKTALSLHASDGFVVGDATNEANVTGQTYYYVAIG